MATMQDDVLPMTDAERYALLGKVSYSEMTPAQQRSFDKRVKEDTKKLSAESNALYEKHFGKLEPLVPRPKTPEELMERLRPKYKKGSPEDILFQAISNGESAVESVRRVRDPCY